MIIFEGIKKDKLTFLLFSNDQGKKISIPIEPAIAERITQYLNLISLPKLELNQEEVQ